MSGVVTVLHLTRQKIGHGLEATVRMGWKTANIVIRIVGNKMIQEQKWI
jgi:hypothetical protein